MSQNRESKLKAIAGDMLTNSNKQQRSDLEWKSARWFLNCGVKPNKAGGAQPAPVRTRSDSASSPTVR
eukprot:7914690-Pyramimonas_sp.AAC.1